MDEVDFTILAATSVFTDFMDKCPPAEACRDAFERTVKATLKMVNASGGFGQQYHPTPASGASSARNSLDQSRLDWSARGSDTTSLSSKPHHHKRHHHNAPISDQTSTVVSDAYSTNPSLLSAFQKGAQYRLSAGPTVKTEPEGFSHMRNLPLPPRSNASSTDNNNNNPVSPETAAFPIDQQQQQQMMPSPSALQQQHQQQRPTPPTLSSPMAEMVGTPTGGFLSPRPQPQQQQQPQQQYSPGAMSFSELQGLEFLQNLNSSSSAASGAGGGAGGGGSVGSGMDGVDFGGLADTQMDLGFGLGWEGLHHDFSGEGQPLDLFDGFFFGGGTQGGNGGGGGGGGI